MKNRDKNQPASAIPITKITNVKEKMLPRTSQPSAVKNAACNVRTVPESYKACRSPTKPPGMKIMPRCVT